LGQEENQSRKIVSRGLGGHEKLLISDPRRRGSVGEEGELEVVESNQEVNIR